MRKSCHQRLSGKKLQLVLTVSGINNSSIDVLNQAVRAEKLQPAEHYISFNYLSPFLTKWSTSTSRIYLIGYCFLTLLRKDDNCNKIY